MIVKMRPVTGGDFEVDIEPDITVDDFKAVVLATRPELADEPTDIKIVYKGKMLKDGSQTIEACGFKDGEFMAVTGKRREAPSINAVPQPAAAPSGTTAAAAQAPAAGAANDFVAAMAAALAQQQQQTQQPGGLLGPPPEDLVNQLCGFGYPRDQVVQALRAAYNNPDRAMGFLLDGNIPPVPEALPQVPPPMAQPQPQVPAAGLAALGGAAGGAGWAEGLLGAQLLTKSGLQPTSQALGGAPVVLLYFSAHWCPPCRRFTPMLATAYGAQGGQRQVQVVFVSRDRDPGSFAEYYGEMPWVAVPFEGPASQSLPMRFGVSGIPSLVALDGATGRELDRNARDTVSRVGFNLSACAASWGVAQGPAPPPAATPAAAPSAPPAAPKVPEPPAVPVDTAICKAALSRLSELEWPEQEVFYATLLKVLNNTLQNPQESKFRSLKKTNAALQSKLFGLAGGAAVDLLKLGGFEDGEETIGLPGPPDGRCTAVRDITLAHAEAEKMNQLRKERDAKIAEAVEKDKDRPPERRFGGGEDGRHSIGRKPPRGGG